MTAPSPADSTPWAGDDLEQACQHHDLALTLQAQGLYGQALDHGQDALQLFVGLDRPRAGTRRLAADIDDVGTLRNETQAIVDGLRGF